MNKNAVGATVAVLAIVCIAAAVAVVMAGSGDRADDSADPAVTATVWLDSRSGDPVEFEGTGATLADILKDALSDHNVSIGSNGNVTSIDGMSNSDDGTWVIFRWSSPGGWAAVSSTSSCFDGMTLAVRYAEATTVDGTVSYSVPEIEVEYTVYYFIQFSEEYNSTTLMAGLSLTDAEKQAGMWISGTGSNNNEALIDAVISAFYPDSTVVRSTGVSSDGATVVYTVQTESGEEVLFSYGTRTDMYGWFLSFFGWADQDNPDGTYTYWSQYSYNPLSDSLDDPDYWDYNSWSFGMYDISLYRYFALVLQTTSVDGVLIDIPAPSTILTGV